jgi:oxalate decarboxylase/phosphoglucose isomerase-like protein (cupin superfamily)
MMAEATETQREQQTAVSAWRPRSAYEEWVESLGVPVHRGYYIEDLRTVEVGWWAERECNAAFLLLAGQEGVTEARVTEIPAGTTLPPLHLAFDEVVYVLEGRGLTTVWATDGGPKKTFEWQKHSLFVVPRHFHHQLSSTQGSARARLLHCNYLPLALQALPHVDYFLHSRAPEGDGARRLNDELFSAARAVEEGGPAGPRGGQYWYGNFFPNMRAWDQLVPFRGRGAGGHVVWVRFPNSPLGGHMSVFPARTYKKAHRHGPGFVIVIPAGEGYSVMWPEGKEKVVIPWHEASVFVPPNLWFHQHFNVGEAPARYLAMSPPRGLSGVGERVENPGQNSIQYPDEEPWIRARFEEELAKRELTSLMPEEAYQDRNYEWDYTT